MPPPSLLFSSFLPSNPFPLKNLPTKISPPKKYIYSNSSTQEIKPIINKLPTPPWMTQDQLLTLPQPQPQLTKRINKTHQKSQSSAYKSLTHGVRGGRSRHAMKKIVHSIKNLSKIEPEVEEAVEFEEGRESAVPWARAEERVVFRREKKVREVTSAEREVEREELVRLRGLARGLRMWVKAKKAGVTREVVDEILNGWGKKELVMVKLVDPLRRNMDRAREIVERLTGGVLILRNKFFILLYRGKDFLPGKVASSVHERELELHDQQLQEEEARAKAIEAIESLNTIDESVNSTSNIGTFSEFKDIQANYLPLNNGTSTEMIKIVAEKVKLAKELKDEEHKLLILKLKIEKSEKLLIKLNSSWRPSEQSADRELLTEEERQSFQKIGLKMDEILLLGRRGVYDGTIESIHQHWKHREVVKIITMQKAFQQITYTARLLEIESGGILVAVEKLRRGHAIIIYRGKNYSRMLKASPDNLLTKREALQRSIEIQRRGSMKYFAWQMQQTIWELKQRLKYLDQKAKELDTGGVQVQNEV